MKIIIPGKPIPKQRPRFSKRGEYVVTYDAQESDKRRIQQILTRELSKVLNSKDKSASFEAGEICRSDIFYVEFHFLLPINSSDSVTVRNKKLWGLKDATCKPDYDNLEKFYLDCANGILWADDRMIIKGQSKKRYSDDPRVEIVVTAKKEIRLPDKAEKVITLFSPIEFTEFVNDAKRISFLDTSTVGYLEGDVLQEWLETAACILSEFALKHSAKLKKVASQGDVIQELKAISEYKTAIDNGVFAIE